METKNQKQCKSVGAVFLFASFFTGFFFFFFLTQRLPIVSEDGEISMIRKVHLSRLLLMNFIIGLECNLQSILFQDILLGSGDLREVEGEKLQCDVIRGCGSFCLQLCILPLPQICRTEGSQIIVCPCSSVFKNRQRNPDAFRSLTFRSHCVYMLNIVFLLLCLLHQFYKCSFPSCVLCFLQVRAFLTRDFHHYSLLNPIHYPKKQKNWSRRLFVCASLFLETPCLVTNQF